MLSRFHLIPERTGRTDRQTDRRTDLLYQSRVRKRNLRGRYTFDVSVVGHRSRASWSAGKHVDEGVLNEGRKDERQTDDHPDVNRFDVGHARQRRPRTIARSCRRQHGQ